MVSDRLKSERPAAAAPDGRHAQQAAAEAFLSVAAATRR